MCWACRRELFSLTGKTDDGNIQRLHSIHAVSLGMQSNNEISEISSELYAKASLCPPDPPVSVPDAHIQRPHRPPLHTRNRLTGPWCFGNDVYYVKVSLHHTRHAYARTRVPTGGSPDRLVSPPSPCWRSDRRGPLSWSPISSRKGQATTRTGRPRAEGSKNSSLSDGNDTSCAVVAQQTKPSSGWSAWAIV